MVTILPTSKVRDKIASVLKSVRETGEPVFITRYSQAEAVLLSIARYNALMGLLEDREDELGRELREEREAYAHGKGQDTETLAVDLPSDIYRRLEEQARRAGTTPESLSRELLEAALQSQKEVGPGKTREVLGASGRVRPLSDTLRRRIIPGVTLDEVRAALVGASGPTLSEIIATQRGPKA